MKATQRSHNGFSLIEIMVVIMIIGLAVGGASVAINLGSAEARYAKAIERFAAYSKYAGQMAVFGGEPLGLILEPPKWRENPLDDGWRYRWQRLVSADGQQKWVDEETLKPIELPVAIELSVSIDGQLWSYDKAPKHIIPIVAFYPSGDVTPFEIEFSQQQSELEPQHITVDVWGEVIWQEKVEQLESVNEFKKTQS